MWTIYQSGLYIVNRNLDLFYKAVRVAEMKNKAAVSLGKLGGSANTREQREARTANLVAARKRRAELRPKKYGQKLASK